MEIKPLGIKSMMIGTMATGGFTRGQEDCAPVPFQLARCGGLDRKSAMRQSGLLSVLARPITMYVQDFLAHLIRQLIKIGF